MLVINDTNEFPGKQEEEYSKVKERWRQKYQKAVSWDRYYLLFACDIQQTKSVVLVVFPLSEK